MSVNSKIITVYLMRHAESSNNMNLSGNKSRNLRETELSDLGKEQVKKVGQVWKNIRFSKVYSSDLKRAMETAQGVVEHQDDSTYQNGKLKPEVEVDENLREMDYGKLNSARYEEITLHYLSLNDPYLEWKYPEGESVLEVGNRMLNVLRKVCSNLLKTENSVENESILIVSHRVSIAALLYLLGSMPIEGVSEKYSVKDMDVENDIKLVANTGYYKFEISQVKGCFKVKVIDKHVISHLEGIDYESFGQVKKKWGIENKLRERLLRNASEKGRKVVACTQQ